ncbi:MAG TPA: dienelactone hydrolase family protein [Chloroflexota bacterium]|nr:dienelactone hydrolase family protein [Chloroflexota bacterium]
MREQMPTEDPVEQTVQLDLGEVRLEGTLVLPPGTRGVVLFAHGSGSSRFSPRNRFVARKLQEGGIGTLLLDLLTRQEEMIDARTGHLRFDIGLLAERVIGAADWLRTKADTRAMRIGYFGASTGAAAAIVAAAREPTWVSAIVSRGGRPDLAESDLRRVQTPTLLIVGGRDFEVLDLNRAALEQLPGVKALEIVPGATHLFEEPGALERVAELARGWFATYLGQMRDRARAA